MRSPEEIAELMAAFVGNPQGQLDQTQFRCDLVDHWGIKEGWRVLEIGCGQGDTTAVLADRVGASGSVLAVDIAPPDYGAPVNLGDSVAYLKAGPLGDVIEFQFNFDLLGSGFEHGSFDVVVLAHCTWYFDSLDQLSQTLAFVRTLTNRLCLSEWSLEPNSVHQFAHYISVMVQGQIAALKSDNWGNIRTPYSLSTLRRMLRRWDWSIESESLVNAGLLQDGKWERDIALSESRQALLDVEMPEKLRLLLGSQLDTLEEIQPPIESLPAYALLATR